ncbi:hypothetical protein ACIQVT_20175 [Streptomyces sp. NPDC100445]|uniref:hypothetical protein n=1 Tax=Streptomyces sp. NPDC100445 TaxID=3366102 RepID=UPI003807CB12
MKALLEVLGSVALVQGALGLLHVFTDWDVGLVGRLGILDGHGVGASVALLALAFALFAVAENRGSG